MLKSAFERWKKAFWEKKGISQQAKIKTIMQYLDHISVKLGPSKDDIKTLSTFTGKTKS